MSVGTDIAAADGAGVLRRWELHFPRYSAAQLFDLVADIESYPRFVPGCVATRIAARHTDGTWLVDNVFGFGPMRAHFRSRAVPQPPERLEIVSQDGPWRRFAMLWRFTDDGDGCRVDVEVEMSFRSALLGSLAGAGLPQVVPRIISAFEERATALYG